MPQHVQRNQSGVCAAASATASPRRRPVHRGKSRKFYASSANLFAFVSRPHLLGSMGAPSLGRRRSNLAADFGESMRDFPKRARANLFEQLESSTCHTSAGTPKFVRLINRTPCEFKFWHKRTSFCSFANSALSVWEKQRPRRVMVSRPSFPPNWPFGGRAANTLPDAGGSEAAVGTCRD